MPVRRAIGPGLVLLASCVLVLAADARAADGGAPAAPAAHADAGAPAGSTDVRRIERKTAQIRALIAGKLAPDVSPASLFDIPLGDPLAVGVEQRRLAALLAGAAPPAVASAGPPAKKKTKKPAPAPKRKPVPRDAGMADGGVADAGMSTAEHALWQARLELDKARYDFLSLPAAKRAALVAAHEQKAPSAQKTEAKSLDVTEQQAEKAASDRQKALQDLKKARSEAVRLVAQERARLLGVREKQARYKGDLIRQQHEISTRSDKTLEWRRRVADLIQKRKDGDASAGQADTAYTELIKNLRAARSDLSAALDAVSADESGVPRAGPDRLDTAGVAIDRSVVDRLRKSVLAEEKTLEDKTAEVRWARASTLLEQVEELNRDRLALYRWLSADKRSNLTSFSPEGLTQARAEVRQVTLVTRFHVLATLHWVAGLKHSKHDRIGDVFATVSLLKLLALLVVFFWWRRRAEGVIGDLRDRLRELTRNPGRETRRHRILGWAERLTGLLLRVHKPLEWLILVWLALTFAGPAVGGLYEVQIIWTVLVWTIGGIIVVDAIDEFLARRGRRRRRKKNTDQLRLRSLRLIGRVTVLIGLTLSLTTQLVGKGTIYAWVLGTCWLAALPIFLVIVRWWRSVIFERMGAQRKNAFTEWIATHGEGWSSFLAAALGGGYLLGVGVGRVARGYVSGFNVTRRVLAYWFRREITKQAKEREVASRREPLDRQRYEALDPERAAELLVPTVADGEVDEVVRCIDAPGGGVFAVVGERGSGKSTLLERIHRTRPDSIVVPCPPGGAAEFRRELCKALELDESAEDAAIIEKINARTEDNTLLVDDAQRLVRPTIGGLDDLDALLALARESSITCTWVFCMGSIIWQYVERARGARPLFDNVIVMQPWSEEGIAELLERRSEEAGIEPQFDEIMLEEERDHDLHAEALARTEMSYYRLLWDYAVGNPAVAIHFWRESLGVEESGRVVVQLFTAPDTSDLERLPDSAVFVLRAIVQLELAEVDDIATATMLSLREVNDAIRYASFRGYLDRIGARYKVSWTWFRAVTRFLQRRHLLSSVKKA